MPLEEVPCSSQQLNNPRAHNAAACTSKNYAPDTNRFLECPVPNSIAASPEDGEVSRHGCERHSGRESDGVDAGKALSFTPVRESSEESRFSSAPSITGRGVRPMCDYSLHHVATRPAKIEDKLVTTKFNNSITRGAAAVGEPNVAVCLLPGRRRSDTSRSRPVPGWPETPPTHFVAVA